MSHTADPPAETADLLRDFAAEVDLFREDNLVSPPPPRGRGRPPGSPNRSTTQLRKLLLQTGYRDPAEFLAALMTRPTLELATVLKCDAIEAAKLQRQCAVDLLPYFHQRMPAEEDTKPAEARPLVVVMTGDAAVVQRRADGVLSIHDVVQHQQVIEAEPAASHDGGSHDEG